MQSYAWVFFFFSPPLFFSSGDLTNRFADRWTLGFSNGTDRLGLGERSCFMCLLPFSPFPFFLSPPAGGEVGRRLEYAFSGWSVGRRRHLFLFSFFSFPYGEPMHPSGTSI